ncbi:ATP-binding protein [Streptomyces jumonjinensis]|uniref:ATP-binding protein n=1 Tax=Streptomyces jumonjinensis TaxID=1945 RepID=UPI0037A4B603
MTTSQSRTINPAPQATTPTGPMTPATDDSAAALTRQRTSYASDKTAPGRAREDVARCLHGWGLGHGQDALTVIASELVTNAVIHTGTRRISVSLRRTAQRTVRLTVTDSSPRVPATPDAAPEDDEHGRGLLLVDALASRWGSQPTATGKRMWAELDIPPEDGESLSRHGEQRQ